MRQQQDTGKSAQIAVEQRSVDEMYTRLDADVDEALSAQARAMASSAEGPADIYARDLDVSRSAATVRRLRSAERSLCFGRIDAEDGTTLHVGRIGLRTDAGEPLLVDWRAEAARPFYAATMASPLGVHRRRHLRLEDRRVVDVSDEILDGTSPADHDAVGDDALVSALSSARTGRMREAAATLQQEQDEIVRSQNRGIIVVDGGPGTGKTIVALHRAAYVLYAFPAIADRGVLVFGPNSRFLTYISEVLPSLGENDVQLATLSDLVGVDPMRKEPDRISRIKGRSNFADGLARWVRAHQPRGVPLRLRTAHGTVLLDSGTIDAARDAALQGGVGHNRARELFIEHVVDDLVNELELQTERELSDFEAEIKDVLGIDIDRMFATDHDVADSHVPAAGLDIDWDRIREELIEDPGMDRVISGIWPRLRAEDVVRDLLRDAGALAAVLPDVSAEDLAGLDGDAAGWSAADLALLDEARTLTEGPPDTMYGHIVVDEAQQLSEMQWRALMRRCPQRSMTVVGDLAQAGPTTTIQTWGDALDPFVEERYAHQTLTVNYRTTAEILQATEPLLALIAPEQRLSRSIRHGEPPTVVTVTEEDAASALDDLIARIRRSHPGELIGIVTTAARSAVLGGVISENEATIVAAPDARGLEFDTVIIVDPDGIRSAGEAGLRDLYVAQTRATKRLVILEITGATMGSQRGESGGDEGI
ncbi:MAG TPA: AAA family ATPase [Microbacterium sp.]|nr:AAA family ATPase [Microbacterium sp.]